MSIHQLKIGICGTGAFAEAFIPLFKAHPLVKELVIADLIPERVKNIGSKFGIKRMCYSMDELCETDVDAIAIFAQRHLHGPLAIQALKAGKHVYCAVPMASSIDEIKKIIENVLKTGLVYMNGETSYYYPTVIYCRERFKAGDFGRFVYGEGNYLHPMEHGFYDVFKRSGGENWKRIAGFPPMFYPTHSTSEVLAVTRARATHVSCMGFIDDNDDGIFRVGENNWDNVFSNQTALMKTSDGGMMRINEFRRVGWWGKHSSNPLVIHGTKACFEENCGSRLWTSLKSNSIEDLTDLLNCARNFRGVDIIEEHELLQRDFDSQFSKVHPVERLPKEFERLRNGHLGSHQFLVDDFVKAVTGNKTPLINAWEAAKYCAPGLVAHESCKRNGELMEIPDFGEPPIEWEILDPCK